MKNVHWGGVRLNDVLALARPKPNAHALEFVSAEIPYVDSLTTQQAGLHDVMLAYEMDGKPLPRVHGAPVRLVIPEMYGYKNVKWLKGINLVAAPRDGYWEQLGYDRDAWVGRSNGYGVMKPGYRRRFSRTERTLHWANAAFFLFLLATGLILYLPSLSVAVGRRPLIQSLHFWSGVAWVVVLAVIVLVGDRRGIAAHRARDRRLRRRRPALADRPQAGAAGSLQRRPEAEHGPDRGVHRALPRHRAAALVRRAEHAASASRARSSCTTA